MYIPQEFWKEREVQLTDERKAGGTGQEGRWTGRQAGRQAGADRPAGRQRHSVVSRY